MENTAKLEFAIDLANQEQLSAFATLFATLSGQVIERPVAAVEATAAATKTASKATKKAGPAKTEAAEPEATKVEPEATKTEPEATKTESEVKITTEAIRDEVSKKIGDHRDKIKAKLTSFGTNNITALAKEHYAEFMDFVKAL